MLEAPPGAGKTIRVPLALLGEAWLAGQTILMLETRRLAPPEFVPSIDASCAGLRHA